MANTITNTIKEAAGYWWLLLLTGIILIAAGIWIFASPAAAYLSLSLPMITFGKPSRLFWKFAVQ